MKHVIRPLLSVLLALTLAAVPMAVSPPSAFGAETNYDQQYELAIGLLQDLMNTGKLREAAQLFGELGAHKLSRYFAYYVDTVIQLQSDDAEAIGRCLDSLPYLAKNRAFTDQLAERQLPSCAALESYAKAKRLELDRRYAEAQAIYESLEILDAIDRTIALIPLVREEQAEAARKAAEEAAAEAARRAAEEAERAEAERQAAEEAARAEAERQAAEEAARQEAERRAAEEAAAVRLPESVRVGDIIAFGRYEQDCNAENGPEPIEWLVLDTNGITCLVLSLYGLDSFYEKGPYSSYRRVDRNWLNGTFLTSAFTDGEQRMILETLVDNGADQGVPGWSTSWQGSVKERLFLLSYAQATSYLGVSVDRSVKQARAGTTAYASLRGIRTDSQYTTNNGSPACAWWLRSPGRVEGYTAFVKAEGTVGYYTEAPQTIAVRPAMRINLAAGK